MTQVKTLNSMVKQNIRRIIDERGATIASVADAMGVEPSSLSRNLTADIGMSLNTLEKIASALNIEPHVLTSPENTDNTIDKIKIADNDEYIEVPVFDVSVSAGYGVEPIKDEDIQEMRLLSRSFLPRKNGEYHILFVDGDSMTPTLKPQEPVLVDVSIKDIVSPGIYVLRINGGLFIKRVDLHPDGTVMVTSDNKAYKDFMIRMGENIKLDVLGKAVLNFQLL